MPRFSLLGELRAIEHTRRELEVREAGLIDQLRRRNLAFHLGCKNATDLLVHLLRIGAPDAAGRVTLAETVTPRRMPTGVLVEPEHPQTAAAFTAGAVSAQAARTVIATVDRPPACVLEEAHPAVEAVLFDFAAEHDPHTLAWHATTVAAALDQDGAFRDAELAARRRQVTLLRRADGSGTLTTPTQPATRLKPLISSSIWSETDQIDESIKPKQAGRARLAPPDAAFAGFSPRISLEEPCDHRR